MPLQRPRVWGEKKCWRKIIQIPKSYIFRFFFQIDILSRNDNLSQIPESKVFESESFFIMFKYSRHNWKDRKFHMNKKVKPDASFHMILFMRVCPWRYIKEWVDNFLVHHWSSPRIYSVLSYQLLVIYMYLPTYLVKLMDKWGQFEEQNGILRM